jgi:hypothetical protein
MTSVMCFDCLHNVLVLGSDLMNLIGISRCTKTHQTTLSSKEPHTKQQLKKKHKFWKKVGTFVEEG